MAAKLPIDELSHPPTHPPSPSTPSYLIFLITGNPGLAGYYTTFTTHLHTLLRISHPATSIRIYARSLAGFETALPTPPKPLGLLAQVDAVKAVLRRKVKEVEDEVGRVKVVLVGHSVGSWILLEILQRVRWEGGVEVVAGVCLFPTVVDIARSPRGRVFTPLLRIPGLPWIAASAARVLGLLPVPWFEALVRSVTGMPPDAVVTTTAFLRSKMGVYQALHMARDEMSLITTDTWDAEIWGAAHPSPTGTARSQLFFYFGEEDHWVAEETREEIIRARGGGEDWRPRMEVDEGGIPHGFCVENGEEVAGIVAGYVRGVLGG
ncbi:hypothetical protein EJ06DRAFT_578878 [Trichodelitschia bisporula]|uniref:Uncharacterized protein n=1 Tax=Trichodelitschia bisporula TaxID=703511 RepID=A0A6G1I872_9PEZI|nr:hypothetical protein EJ06DRAFT_578878 [Trichodelitschia bisporula]